MAMPSGVGLRPSFRCPGIGGAGRFRVAPGWWPGVLVLLSMTRGGVGCALARDPSVFFAILKGRNYKS